MKIMEYSRLTVVISDDLDGAIRDAAVAAANSSGQLVPGVAYTQGARRFVATALPAAWLSDRAKTAAPKSGASGVPITGLADAMNRPHDPGHSKEIGRYLARNAEGQWILPAVTINVGSAVKFFTVGEPEAQQQWGWLVIPADVAIYVTDGQHRLAGVRMALKELDRRSDAHRKLVRASLAATVAFDADVNQIRQDFADVAKSKPLPPAMLAIFDTRSPVNTLCAVLEQAVPVFQGRIESVARSLGKRTPMLFTSSHLRAAVKAILAGSHAVNENVLAATAERRIGNDADYRREEERVVGLFTLLSEEVQEWREIATAADPAEVVVRLRESGSLMMSPAGLLIVARLAHDWFRDGADWPSLANRVARIDWHRESPTWSDNVVRKSKDGTIRLDTSARAINEAAAAVARRIGAITKPADDLNVA